jgi:enoyl-CoA hydratase/carnithine racemase
MGGGPKPSGDQAMRDRYGDTVNATTDGHVAVLEFSRPPHNFASVGLMRDLANALDDIDADRNLRATALFAAGKSFCAGADLASREGVGGEGMQGVSPLYHEAVRLFSSKKPIVAAVQGAAVGAGLGLALVADFRVAAPEARFCANFVKLGFHPGFGVTYTLPRVVGGQRAALMCLTGRRIKGEEALAWGLADALAPLETLHEATLALARELAENAPLAVEATRATMRAGLAAAVKAQTDHELVEQTRLRATKDFAEGVRAVNERRPGVFTGT